MILALLLAMVGFPAGETVEHKFDMIEINYKYDKLGNLQFCQLLPHTWMPDYQRYICEGFIMIGEGEWFYTTYGVAVYRPIVSCDQKGDRLDELGLVRFKSKIVRTTHTYYDPEMEDKKLTKDRHRWSGWKKSIGEQ